MKFKPMTITKRFNGDAYTFRRGKVIIEGMWHRNGKPYTMTLKEFKEVMSSIGAFSINPA